MAQVISHKLADTDETTITSERPAPSAAVLNKAKELLLCTGKFSNRKATSALCLDIASQLLDEPFDLQSALNDSQCPPLSYRIEKAKLCSHFQLPFIYYSFNSLCKQFETFEIEANCHLVFDHFKNEMQNLDSEIDWGCEDLIVAVFIVVYQSTNVYYWLISD
jgi:hypothetical protein